MLTVAYAMRFYWGAFVAPGAGPTTERQLPEAPPWAFVAPAAVLALVGVVLGVAPGIADALATASLAGYGAECTRGAPGAVARTWVAARALRAHPRRRGRAVRRPSMGRNPCWLGEARCRAAARSISRPSRPLGASLGAGDRVRPERIAAGVRRRHPVTAAAFPPVALLVGMGLAGMARRSDPCARRRWRSSLVVAALGAATVRRRFSAAVFLGVAGYAMAGLFVLSGAPDLALTQAVGGDAVDRRVRARAPPPARALRAAVDAPSPGGAVLVAIAVGRRDGVRVRARGRWRPADVRTVSDEIVARSVPDGHGRNVVNVILVDFRGFDTLGEITVLAVGVDRRGGARPGGRGEPLGARRTQPAPTSDVRRLAFVDVSGQLVFHAVLMMSLWLLFAGHNQPGGGFVGGLLAGSAIALRYIAGGIDEVRGRSRFRPWTVLGAGLLLAAVTAVVPLLAGSAVLDVGVASLDLPLIGTVKVSSALAFDVGVYLTVVGMVLMAFEAFGDGPSGGADVTVMLAAAAAALFGIGTYLVLQRKLSRIIIGLGL